MVVVAVAAVDLVRAERKPSRLQPLSEVTGIQTEAIPTARKRKAKRRARKEEAAATRSRRVITIRRERNVNGGGHEIM